MGARGGVSSCRITARPPIFVGAKTYTFSPESLAVSVRLYACALVALVGTTACGEVTVDGGRDLEVSVALEASTITAGDSARLTIAATGKDLVEFTVFWRDQSEDSVQTFNAFGAEVLNQQRTHLYSTAGTFDIHTRVTELEGDTASATTTLQVDPAP